MAQGWLRKTSSFEAATRVEPAGTRPAVGWSWVFKLSHYLSLQKQKSCEAHGFQIPLSTGSKRKPWNIFQLAPHPMPSADESERKGKAEVWDHRLPPPSPPHTETSLVGRKCLLLISTAENRHSLWWKNMGKAQETQWGWKQQLCIKPPQYLWLTIWEVWLFWSHAFMPCKSPAQDCCSLHSRE